MSVCRRQHQERQREGRAAAATEFAVRRTLETRLVPPEVVTIMCLLPQRPLDALDLARRSGGVQRRALALRRH